MTQSLENALNNVGITYQETIEIANSFVDEYTESANAMIKWASENVESLSNDVLRDLLLRLTLQSYSFGDVKERASFKASIAKALRDEAKARNLLSADGTVATKDSVSTLAISAEIIVTEIYNLVASLLKTKLDELHRVVDTMKTVLSTRLSEAKLTNIGG